MSGRAFKCLNRVFHLLCALVLSLQLCGGHLGMLQVVAWSGMLVSYTQEDGVVEGARKTFDGEHPCSLCDVISKSRVAEQNDDRSPKAPSPDWSKFGKELACFEEPHLPARLDGQTSWQPAMAPDKLTSADPATPPLPPPRLA